MATLHHQDDQNKDRLFTSLVVEDLAHITAPVHIIAPPSADQDLQRMDSPGRTRRRSSNNTSHPRIKHPHNQRHTAKNNHGRHRYEGHYRLAPLHALILANIYAAVLGQARPGPGCVSIGPTPLSSSC